MRLVCMEDSVYRDVEMQIDACKLEKRNVIRFIDNLDL